MNKGYEKVKHILVSKTIERFLDFKKKYYENPKKCVYCNQIIPYNKRLNDKFCNSSCAVSCNNSRRIHKIKYCLNCEAELVNLNSKFCSSICSSLYRKKTYIDGWLAGKISGRSGEGVSHYIRNYLMEQCANKCEECGWSKINPHSNRIPLTVEHIDGNYLNCVRSNLKVLCPNCHSLTKTYGGLNKGNGRIIRRQKRRLRSHGV